MAWPSDDILLGDNPNSIRVIVARQALEARKAAARKQLRLREQGTTLALRKLKNNTRAKTMFNPTVKLDTTQVEDLRGQRSK